MHSNNQIFSVIKIFCCADKKSRKHESENLSVVIQMLSVEKARSQHTCASSPEN